MIYMIVIIKTFMQKNTAWLIFRCFKRGIIYS